VKSIDPIAELKKRQGTRSFRAHAAEIGVSAMFLCDIHKRRRGPGPKVLEYLGLEEIIERRVTYRKRRSDDGTS
jgi:hypothetical protein